MPPGRQRAGGVLRCVPAKALEFPGLGQLMAEVIGNFTGGLCPVAGLPYFLNQFTRVTPAIKGGVENHNGQAAV